MLFPGEIATVSLGEPVENFFSVPYSLMDFMETIFTGFQSSMFWRVMSQVEVFKDKVPGVGHFVSQGETGSEDFPPDCILWLQGWGLCRDFVSAFSNALFFLSSNDFSVGFLLFTLCIGFTQLVSAFLFEGVVLCKTVDSLRPMGGKEIWNQYVMSEQESSPLLSSFLSPSLSLCHSYSFVSVCPSFSHSPVLVLSKPFFFLDYVV